MGEDSEETAQWTLDVTVFHGRGFGHRIRARVLDRRGGWNDVGTWTWTGSGVPAPLLLDIEARVRGVIAEHLISRYGLAERLAFEHQGDPGIT
jgi:hypothetical protein